MKQFLIVASLLATALLATACGSAHPQPETARSQTSSTPAHAETAAPVASLRVYTSYMDFSGHGYNASGQWYAQRDGGWISAHCSISHVADPEAGGGGGPMCGEWGPVPEAQWPTLARLRANSEEANCADHVADCTELGLAVEPSREIQE